MYRVKITWKDGSTSYLGSSLSRVYETKSLPAAQSNAITVRYDARVATSEVEKV